MKDDPMLQILMIAGTCYLGSIWWKDLRAWKTHTHAVSNPLPGATSATVSICIWAAFGALILLALETWGEIALGVSGEQSDITLLFGLYTLVAPIIEEIMFRGFVVVTGKGRFWIWCSVLVGSAGFALLHPFLWEFKHGDVLFAVSEWEWIWHFDTKGIFSTVVVFAASLWFYTVRFWKPNPHYSLLPCFAAHFAKNLGVLVIKGIQGHVIGLW